MLDQGTVTSLWIAIKCDVFGKKVLERCEQR
jgi:hypothetical protein